MTEILRIEVIPSSNKEEIIKVKPLIVKVKEAPIKARANTQVCQLRRLLDGLPVSLLTIRWF